MRAASLMTITAKKARRSDKTRRSPSPPTHHTPAPPEDAQSFFGFREKPFALSPDPKFLFRGRSHGAAISSLVEGIHQLDGLITLTGDIGTGKTTLYRAVLEQMASNTHNAVLLDPLSTREEFLKSLLVDFGVVGVEELGTDHLRNASRTELSYVLRQFLAGQIKSRAAAIIVVDEAQNLTSALWEEIRILTDTHSRETPVHVVLAGQPQLAVKLRQADMERMSQRISLRCTLEPLELDEIQGFISHRLAVAGAADAVEFSSEAIARIYAVSRGVPRLMTLLCDRTLHEAFLRRSQRIDVDMVEAGSARLGTPLPPTPGVGGFQRGDVSREVNDWIVGLDDAVEQTPKAPLDTSSPRASRDWNQPHIPLLKRILGFPG